MHDAEVAVTQILFLVNEVSTFVCVVITIAYNKTKRVNNKLKMICLMRSLCQNYPVIQIIHQTPKIVVICVKSEIMVHLNST